MPRKIIFAAPPYHCGVVEVAGSWPSLGLVLLGAQAGKAGWEAEIYDAMTLRHDYDKIRAHLRTVEFDVFATTAITPTFPDAAKLCAVAKEVNPGCTTLMGGVHPTSMLDGSLRGEDGAINYFIAGEGEHALHEFLSAFDEPDRLAETPGLACLLDWPLYKYYVIPGSRLGAVSSSRGCNFECTFCSQQRFWDKTWRGRGPEAVFGEIEFLAHNHGVNVFLLTDEYPTKEADRWEEILDRIIAADLDIYLLMETRVQDINRDEAILPKYRKAGVVHIYVGAEATDQATLDAVNKELSVDESRSAIDLIAAHDMISETSFVLGFPDETKDSIEETLRLVREFNLDFAHFLAITPWPYADLYKDVEQYIEVYDYGQYNLIEPILRPKNMTREQVDLAIINCYRWFYMPKMLDFRKVDSPFRKDYLLRSMKLIMQSSFLVGKFARLGLNPKVMMREVLGGSSGGVHH